SCSSIKTWWSQFIETVNDIIFRCNVHSCETPYKITINIDNTKIKWIRKGCLDADDICKACFPHEIHETTTIDEDGHVSLKKSEPMMNTFTLTVSYLTRCNTDVTSLLSGTAIKAIVSYVTDYITKPMLKSHQIFSS
ncbi:hypothetical protein FA15DRAFT_561556, partial [Coprinopsis marcescibilis]